MSRQRARGRCGLAIPRNVSDSARHVEDIAQTFAVSLQQNREARIARGNAQQIIGALRCCHRGVRPSVRRRGSSSARLAASRNFAANNVSTQADVHQIRASAASSKTHRHPAARPSRKTEHEAVPHSTFVFTSNPQPSPSRSPPWPTARARGCRTASGSRRASRRARSRTRSITIVPIIRDLLRRELLVNQITQNILGRLLIEIVLARQPGNRSTARQLAQFANQRADAPAELNGGGLIPVPERHLARLTGRRAHQHTILRDLVDAPRGRAQTTSHQRALKHHLLIELTDTQRFRVPSAHEDSIQATIRNRAAIEDGNPMHTLARCNPVSLPYHVTRGRNSANSSDG